MYTEHSNKKSKKKKKEREKECNVSDKPLKTEGKGGKNSPSELNRKRKKYYH